MTAEDYSGVHAGGPSFGRAGRTLFGVGLAAVLVGVLVVGAIAVLVILYGLALRGM